MRKVLFLGILLSIAGSSVLAQSDSAEIRKVIDRFFTGMETWDTATVSSTVDSTFFLYSIMRTKAGGTILQKETQEGFFGQIISLKGKKYDEQILSAEIKVDGAMAIAWTPYKFIYEGTLSHCGVNVFTLIKRESGWKILGITDTRRRQGCE